MDFQQRLYEMRKQSSLSQEGLASLLGVTRQAVQKWESGSSRPDMDNLAALATDPNPSGHTQIDGTTETVMNSAPLEDKLRAFNFNVVTINGHDFDQIESAVRAFHAETEKPTCIILDTVKGTGVSYMTNSVAWHGKGPNDEEYQVAMNELNAAYAALEQEEN